MKQYDQAYDMHEHRVCIFVSSSDNTKDVFTQVFRSFDTCWQDCEFEKFVGLNTVDPGLDLHGFQPVYAPVSGWRSELLTQILQLPVSFTHVLLFLDDFLLLADVDSGSLAPLIAAAIERGIAYLRFRTVRRAFIPALFAEIKNMRAGAAVERIPEDFPYYSSLQVTLWKREHLIEMLRATNGTIWDFELQKPGAGGHYAVVNKLPIQYAHVVEKGLWQHDAPAIFHKAGIPFAKGSRPIAPAPAVFTSFLSRFRFFCFGFMWLRLRACLRRISSQLYDRELR